MLIKSIIYYIGTFLLLGLAPYFLTLTENVIYILGVIALLLPPFIAGFFITRKHKLTPTKSNKWLFSALMSAILIAFLTATIFYAYSTNTGRIMIDAALTESKTTFGTMFTIAFGFMFFVYLFCNRIGYGIGSMAGKTRG